VSSFRFDWIDGTELGPAGFLALVERALALRAGAAPRQFPGKRIVAVFLNSSLRTRVSMEAAANDLGIHLITLNPGADAWKLEHRAGVRMDGDAAEHFADAIPALAEYADALALRAFAGLKDAEDDHADPVLAAFRRWSPKPVINLESALWHPLQALADAATWRRHLGPELRGRRIALTWAPHPRALPAAVPNQLALTAGLLGMNLTIAHPPGFDLDPRITDRAAALAREHGGDLRIVDDPDAAMDGAEVVHAKSWSGFAGYGRREDEAAVRATLGRWTLDADRFARAGSSAGFMHCLPVRRNVVVTDEVLDGPCAWTTETAGNRRWTAMALLEELFSRGN
jgi:N-acetylornithine carbamoyltransferase